jgi:hypothetical protein
MASPGSSGTTDGSDGSSVSFGSTSVSGRPNNWTGHPSTWRKLTKRERLISTSLDQLRNQDLAIHLYNAHAMKRRHYDLSVSQNIKPWTSKVYLQPAALSYKPLICKVGPLEQRQTC